MIADIDFAVLHPRDGLTFHTTTADELQSAILGHIPDKASQGMGHLCAWFNDSFTAAMPPNPLAAHILGAIGYDPSYPWRGTVVITAESRSDERAGLTADMRAALEDLAEQWTRPSERN